MADRSYRIFDNEEDVFKETWEKYYWEIQDVNNIKYNLWNK